MECKNMLHQRPLASLFTVANITWIKAGVVLSLKSDTSLLKASKSEPNIQ